MYRAIITALALAVSAAPLAGQSAPQRITFDDAVGIALKQNVTVRQAENATELEQTAVRQSQLAFLPDLRFNVSGSGNLGRNFNQTEGTIVDQTTGAMSTGISSSVTLWNGGQNTANPRAPRLGEPASAQEMTRTRPTVVFTRAPD